MIVARCPRCERFLREVQTRHLFAKHAGCIKCGVLYVIWGEAMTRCLTPTACAGPQWSYIADIPEDSKKHTPGPEHRGLL